MRITNANWAAFSKALAAPADPLEYSPAAVRRLVETVLSDHIIDVKGVRPQFHEQNSCMRVDFASEHDRQYYNTYWEKFQENQAKIRAAGLANEKFLLLVEQMKFLQAADMCHANTMAPKMHETVTKDFKAAVCVLKYKSSIAKVVQSLVRDYKVPRSQISLIWGGFNSNLTNKLSPGEINKIIRDLQAGRYVDKKTVKRLEHQLQRDIDGLDELDIKGLELGMQNARQRQEEIDRFQSGVSKYCIITYKSGGVGLSLHHCDELTKQKVRRRPDNNWAFLEDIPLIPTWPRRSFLTPTYSAIELVQGLGRCPRLTSLSNTQQFMQFFRGTVEEAVMAIVSQKLRCLREVVRSRESWEDVIFGDKSRLEEMLKEAEAKAEAESKRLMAMDKTDEGEPAGTFELDGDVQQIEENEDEEALSE